MSHYTNEKQAKKEAALANELKKVEEKARKKAILERDIFKGLQIRPTASVEDDAPDREPGDSNWAGYGFDIHPHVTLSSTAILLVFITLTLMFKQDTSAFFKSALESITNTTGWFLILASNIFIVAAFYFAFGRFGTIRLGGTDAKPEFSLPHGLPCCSALAWG